MLLAAAALIRLLLAAAALIRLLLAAAALMCLLLAAVQCWLECTAEVSLLLAFALLLAVAAVSAQ